MLEKTTRMNFLFDFYKKLLTDKQRTYMELYFLEDYSLGEISKKYDISRQAVYDNIKRTEQILENYEERLMLHERFQKRVNLLNQLEEHIKQLEDIQALEILHEIKQLD